jgi:hypothetical protein
VVAPVATAPTAIRSSSSVVTIIPPTAVRISAPIHPIPTPIPATGSTAILIAEQLIASLPPGNLVANGFRCHTPLPETLSVPFDLTSQIRQLG